MAFNVNKDGLAVGALRDANGNANGFIASPAADLSSSAADVWLLDTEFAVALSDPSFAGLRINIGYEINAAGQIAGTLIPEYAADTASASEVHLFRGDLVTGAIEIVDTFVPGIEDWLSIKDMNEYGDILAEGDLLPNGLRTLYLYETSRPGVRTEVELDTPSDCLNSNLQTLYNPRGTGISYRFSFVTESVDNLNEGLKRRQTTDFHHLAESGAAYGLSAGALGKWSGPAQGFIAIDAQGWVRDVSTSMTDEEVLIENGYEHFIYRDSDGVAKLELTVDTSPADLARWGEATGWRYDVWSVSNPAMEGGRGYISGTPAVGLEQTYAFILTPVLP